MNSTNWRILRITLVTWLLLVAIAGVTLLIFPMEEGMSWDSVVVAGRIFLYSILAMLLLALVLMKFGNLTLKGGSASASNGPNPLAPKEDRTTHKEGS